MDARDRPTKSVHEFSKLFSQRPDLGCCGMSPSSCIPKSLIGQLLNSMKKIIFVLLDQLKQLELLPGLLSNRRSLAFCCSEKMC